MRDNRLLITLRPYIVVLYRHLHVGLSSDPNILGGAYLRRVPLEGIQYPYRVSTSMVVDSFIWSYHDVSGTMQYRMSLSMGLSNMVLLVYLVSVVPLNPTRGVTSYMKRGTTLIIFPSPIQY